MTKNTKQNQLKKDPVFFKEEEFRNFQSLWKQIIPILQKLTNTFKKYEVVADMELIKDVLSGGIKAKEVYQKNIVEQIEGIVSSPILRESLLKIDHEKVFRELNVFVQEHSRIISSKFYDIPMECFSLNHCEFNNGVISISENTIDEIKKKYFFIYLENDEQRRAFELSKTIKGQLEELTDLFQKKNPFDYIPIGSLQTPEVKFEHLFIESEGKFDFNIRILDELK